MKIRRTTRTTIHAEETLTIRTRAGVFEDWCPQCGCQGLFIGLDQAAIIASADGRRLQAWAEQGSLHFIQRVAGAPLVCLSSLTRNIETT